MSRGTAPEPWASAMREAGLVNHEEPSMRQLAARADLSVETVRQMLYGTRHPDIETQEAVAKALGLDTRTVAEWVGTSRTEADDWTPPAESALLSSRQRKALDELIRAMAESEASSDAAPIGTGQSFTQTQLEDGVRRFRVGHSESSTIDVSNGGGRSKRPPGTGGKPRKG